MEELFDVVDYEIPVYKRGEEVQGKIVSIQPNKIFIDIGGKSYGLVPPREVSVVSDLLPKLSEGDEITAKVIIPEDEYGQVILSLRKSGAKKRWELLHEAFDNDTEIEVVGIDTVKGGLLVDYSDIRGFVPASQLDPAFMNNPSQLRGRTLGVKILELDEESNRFVLSQKAVTQKELVASQQEAIQQVKENDVLKAKVTGIVPFGAFAQVFVPIKDGKELVGVEGLIHISEIAWERVVSPSDYVSVGREIEVKVIGKDAQGGKLNLSLKQLTPDPWEHIKKRYKAEKVVSGIVTRTSHFGVFVQLEKGVEGLIHISKMPVEFSPKVGDKIEAVIETLDLKKRKLSLSVVAKEKPIGYR